MIKDMKGIKENSKTKNGAPQEHRNIVQCKHSSIGTKLRDQKYKKGT